MYKKNQKKKNRLSTDVRARMFKAAHYGRHREPFVPGLAKIQKLGAMYRLFAAHVRHGQQHPTVVGLVGLVRMKRNGKSCTLTLHFIRHFLLSHIALSVCLYMCVCLSFLFHSLLCAPDACLCSVSAMSPSFSLTTSVPEQCL